MSDSEDAYRTRHNRLATGWGELNKGITAYSAMIRGLLAEAVTAWGVLSEEERNGLSSSRERDQEIRAEFERRLAV